MPKNHGPPGVNSQTVLDMTNARSRSSINVESVRDFLYNGRHEWERRQRIVVILENDPVFDKSQRGFMTRTERYRRGLAMTNRIYELKEIHRWSSSDANTALNLLDEELPMNLHSAAFEPVFLSQGTPALIAKYGRLIENRGILGCYLQTELGHGTNLPQLETTATFLLETQEFEINSPTLTSKKYWIGALAKTANFGVIQAKLILPGGKDVGPHLFLLQLRSLEDHTVLPGIVLGDIGPKVMGGYSPTDNGFASFDHVRIPKENMLSKFAQVTEEGNYVQPPHAKISYGGMLYIRSRMVISGGWVIAKAATISIRYATVRRQGEKGADGLENQIINYPSVHYRLLPILSHAYVFIQLGRNLAKAFDTMSTRLALGDASLLAEMHAVASGLKVLVSTTGIQDIEVARRSMGGHGYSSFSGLGRLYADYLPSATYEGDNFVLDRQVVRAAVKSYNQLLSMKNQSGHSLSPSSSYLRLLLQPTVRMPVVTDSSWRNFEELVLLLEWRAALILQEYAQHISHSDANANQRVSKAVTEAFVAVQVNDIIKSLTPADQNTQALKDLFRLYLLTTLEAGLVDLLSFGLLRPSDTEPSCRDPTRSLRLAISELCLELIPNVIGLTDAFAFTDWELDSALGMYDGSVYEALWKRAQAEPLNHTDVPEAYEEFIKPMLLRSQRLSGLSKL